MKLYIDNQNFLMKTQKNFLLSDVFEIHFLELKKLIAVKIKITPRVNSFTPGVFIKGEISRKWTM